MEDLVIMIKEAIVKIVNKEDLSYDEAYDVMNEIMSGETTPTQNAKIVIDILNGQKGHKRNAVLMNAGASLYIGGKAESMEEGIKLAAEIIDSGKALETLNKMIEVSNRPEAALQIANDSKKKQTLCFL